ncbi:ATP-binding protein, partial [Streptomyces sp. 2MCAF27]
MACLEHATELSPVIREQITARTDKILPPKDIEQARALASVGSMVLELLPGPGGLSPEEARSVVLTAAILGDDAAIPLLSEYSKHFSVTVREELVSSWSKFDCKRYGEEVLAHVDEKDLYFSAISSSQLEVLKTLGGRARVELIGDFGSAEIGELGADRLTHLRIRGNSRIQTLDSLQNFPMLHHLTLSGCAELSSLSSIAGLSLRHLTFSGLDKIGNLEALGELSSLEYLYVGSPSYLPRGLMNLPQGAPLRDLHLPGVPLPRGWLREIYRWPDLQYLT